MLKHTVGASALVLAMAGGAMAQDQSIIVQSTTSTANSGLYDYLLPIFQEETGIQVNVVAVGTGQAIKNAQNCDGDVLLVHAKPSEEKFVEAGYGTDRTDLMYNDFVIVGPEEDPAGVGGMDDVQGALSTIAGEGALFASRGDDSGTHKKEMALWHETGIAPGGGWYRAVGAGMGAALNTASGMNAYIMADRASWLNFGNKGDLAVLHSGDPRLFNQYAYLPVNPEKHPHVKADAAQRLEDWLTSQRAAELIDGYRLSGEQLFTFNAGAGS